MILYYFQPRRAAKTKRTSLERSEESSVYLYFLSQLRQCLPRFHYKSQIAEAWSTCESGVGHHSLVIHKETPPHTLPRSPHWSESFRVSQKADSWVKSEKNNSASRKSRDHISALSNLKQARWYREAAFRKEAKRRVNLMCARAREWSQRVFARAAKETKIN